MNVRIVLAQQDGTQLLDERFHVDLDKPLTFGRSRDHNRLHLPDESKMVSGRHGCIEWRDGVFWVVDLGSTNGTILDGVPVVAKEPARLSDGSLVRVGAFDLRVLLAADAGSGGGGSGDDLNSTLVGFGAEPGASGAFASLCSLYARLRRSPPAVRRQELLRELQRSMGGRELAQQRSLLGELRQRAGVAAEASGPAEEMLQSCCSALQRMARDLVDGPTLGGPRDVTRFSELVRTFFTLTLDWLARSMAGRAEFEGQFGAEVTLVFQRSNNPLKGQGAEELSRSLFDWTSGREVAEVHKQLSSVFRDLSQHQLGLLAGVKEAVAAVMERLSPESIETLAMRDAGWLTSKGAKAWEVYRQIYGEFFEEKSKLFHEVISPAIRQGYLSSHDGPPA